ncbi:hypothetical protein D3C85_985990 [compost metagenome]
MSGEGFGGSHTDFTTRLGQQGQVGFTHQRTDADVANGQAGEETQLFGIAQGRQGIGGFAGLGNGHKQGVGLNHHLAVTELAGNFNLARDTGQFFKPVTGNHAGVIAGATSHDLHIAHFGEQFGRLRAERLHQYLVLAQATFQGTLYNRRLLVDFLEHEVTELALLGRFSTITVLHRLTLHRLAVDIPDLHAVTADFGDVALFQVHEAIGDLTQRQLVGGEEVLTQAQANHQRAATASRNQTIRLQSTDHRQTVSTVQLFDGGLKSNSQVDQFFELVIEQVSDHFGIGVGGEHVTQCLELFAQGFVVFDDAVVHHGQIAGEVRVSVAFTGCAVGCPTGVGNPQATCQRLSFQSLLQFADLARTTHTLKRVVVGKYRNTSAVIAPVFKALEALEQNGGDVTFRNRADNSTHAISPG